MNKREPLRVLIQLQKRNQLKFSVLPKEKWSPVGKGAKGIKGVYSMCKARPRKQITTIDKALAAYKLKGSEKSLYGLAALRCSFFKNIDVAVSFDAQQ